MIKHSLDTVKDAVEYLNPGQTVIFFGEESAVASTSHNDWTTPQRDGFHKHFRKYSERQWLDNNRQ